MGEMFTDFFDEYADHHFTDQDRRANAWSTATGLRAADGLNTSFYLRKTAAENIAGKISMEEAVQKIAGHYSKSSEADDSRTGEADLISARTAAILYRDSFDFSVPQIAAIHEKLFKGIFDHAGTVRDENISRQEPVLNGETVIYGGAGRLMETLGSLFAGEKEYDYPSSDIDHTITHLAAFTADLWQIHPFVKGNTRVTAVFLINYLRFLGYPLMNAVFAENALYFRGALVRANYTIPEKGIRKSAVYLEVFLRNLLTEERADLRNEDLRIR